MCGFAGLISWDDRHRASRELIEAMSLRIAHRGPDGQGIYISPNQDGSTGAGHAALAHRRLAILDPDPRANQPFADGQGRWIVFNGEIYNFRELRKELESLDSTYAWRTTGDTEVLLRAYAQWGTDCVERLNGMFAFAIWDEPANSLFLARDRMGQKPLYIARIGNEKTSAIAFASELGALGPVPWIDRTLNESALVEYLRYAYIPHELTIYRGCQKLPAGCWMRVSPTDARRQEYFDPNETPAGQSPADPVARTRELVMQAVSRQLVSDVPLGVLLSGGIDSSVVAACARQAGEVRTFSVGFDDPRYDESAKAKQVARHLGTKHTLFRATFDAAADLPKLAEVYGEPFADSSALPTHLLSRETRKHVKVVLSGDGGDELFGGYDRYRALRLGQRLAPLANPLVRSLARRVAGSHPKSRRARAGRFFASLGQSPARRYDGYVRLFDDAALTQLAPGLKLLTPPWIEMSFTLMQGHRDAVQAALALDRRTYLPDDLLAKVDRASMLHALEVRSPFMDHHLVRFAAGLSTDNLLSGGPKRMLRLAFAADLPEWVFTSRKMGFAVPIGDWFRGPLRPMLRDHLFASGSFSSNHFSRPALEQMVSDHESARVDHSQRLYALLMLELWKAFAKTNL